MSILNKRTAKTTLGCAIAITAGLSVVSATKAQSQEKVIRLIQQVEREKPSPTPSKGRYGEDRGFQLSEENAKIAQRRWHAKKSGAPADHYALPFKPSIGLSRIKVTVTKPARVEDKGVRDSVPFRESAFNADVGVGVPLKTISGESRYYIPDLSSEDRTALLEYDKEQDAKRFSYTYSEELGAYKFTCAEVASNDQPSCDSAKRSAHGGSGDMSKLAREISEGRKAKKSALPCCKKGQSKSGAHVISRVGEKPVTKKHIESLALKMKAQDERHTERLASNEQDILALKHDFGKSTKAMSKRSTEFASMDNLKTVSDALLTNDAILAAIAGIPSNANYMHPLSVGMALGYASGKHGVAIGATFTPRNERVKLKAALGFEVPKAIHFDRFPTMPSMVGNAGVSFNF